LEEEELNKIKEEEETDTMAQRRFLSIRKPKYLSQMPNHQYVIHQIKGKYMHPKPEGSLADKIVKDVLEKEMIKQQKIRETQDMQEE
jgi:hypothetical protein